MNIGEKIKECRKNAGLSQKSLGAKLNISQQQIAQYESGKRIPKINTIGKIAEALNIPFSDFIDDVNYHLLLGNDEKKQSIYVNTEIEDEKHSLTYSEGIWIHDKNMLHEFHKLNSTGKAEAIRRVEELTYIPKYTEDENLPF